MEKIDHKPYRTGKEFLDDMKKSYGVNEAIRKALHYLLIPLPTKQADKHEEMVFRGELVSAMEDYFLGISAARHFECETHDCAYNNQGECRFYLVKERGPKITEDEGCLDGLIDLFSGASGSDCSAYEQPGKEVVCEHYVFDRQAD